MKKERHQPSRVVVSVSSSHTISTGDLNEISSQLLQTARIVSGALPWHFKVNGLLEEKSAVFVYESAVDMNQHKERYIPCRLTFFVAMITFLYLMSWTILSTTVVRA